MVSENPLREEDKKFLDGLEKRCHEIVTDTTVRPSHTYSHYHNVKLTQKEMRRILAIVNRSSNVLLRPINGAFGFHPAFQVVYFEDTAPGIETEDHESLLCFDRNQLPKGYDFTRLVEYFASQGNLQKAKFAGLEFETEEHHYTY